MWGARTTPSTRGPVVTVLRAITRNVETVPGMGRILVLVALGTALFLGCAEGRSAETAEGEVAVLYDADMPFFKTEYSRIMMASAAEARERAGNVETIVLGGSSQDPTWKISLLETLRGYETLAAAIAAARPPVAAQELHTEMLANLVALEDAAAALLLAIETGRDADMRTHLSALELNTAKVTDTLGRFSETFTPITDQKS